jgi:hypothetical protein
MKLSLCDFQPTRLRVILLGVLLASGLVRTDDLLLAGPLPDRLPDDVDSLVLPAQLTPPPLGEARLTPSDSKLLVDLDGLPLAAPYRVSADQSGDLLVWSPAPTSNGVAVIAMDGGPLFVRLGARDPRTLEALTPESLRNLWARLLAGCLSVMNSGGTMGNGTRGSATFGRTFATTDYEVVARTLWSLGGWFYHPNRPRVLAWTNPVDGSAGSVDVAAFALNALRNGTDPSHAQRWPQTFNGGNLSTMQPSVEAANIAWTFWALRQGGLSDTNAPWHDLTATQIQNTGNWLALHGSVPGGAVNNGNIYNWNLFFALNQESRKRLSLGGVPDLAWSQSQIDNALLAVDDLHRGGGWYSDFGSYDIFEDYNNWTFATHLLLRLHLAAADSATALPGRPARDRAAQLAELRSFLAQQAFFYDSRGRNPEFGRSSTYKVARLAGLTIGYAVDRLTRGQPGWEDPVFPASITPGQLKRLVRMHLNHYLAKDMFDWSSGLIHEGLTPDGSANLFESYLIHGSTYWNMILFAGLWMIPDDDAFWTVPEEAIPAQRGTFFHWLDVPGFALLHAPDAGDLRQYNLRSNYRTDAWAEAQYHAKYAKFAYSSHFGFALPGASRSDQMIRVAGGSRGLIEAGDIVADGEPGMDRLPVLRTKHLQGARTVNTLIFLRGDLEIRVHRITGGSGTFTLAEGGFALGHATGEVMPAPQTGADWTYLQSSRGAVFQARLLGYGAQNVYTATGNHSRDPVWRNLLSEASNQSAGVVVATLHAARVAPFDPAAVRAAVTSVAVNGNDVTVTYADGQSRTAAFLP